MKLTWNDRKLERTCRSDKEGQRTFGAPRWKKLKMRIAVLEAATTLADVTNTPGGWHPLTADRAGTWAASLDKGYRLTFRPDVPEGANSDDGRIDLERVTHVRVMEVVDYHGN